MGMMGRRLFATASAISLLAAVLVAVLWVWSYSDQAENGSLYGGLVVWNPVRVWAFGGATYIYNQNVPYTGSIIGILSANGTRPRWVRHSRRALSIDIRTAVFPVMSPAIVLAEP